MAAPTTSSRGRPFKPKAKKDDEDELTGEDESDDDSDDEVTVMGVTIPNTIPVPGFIVAVIIDSYETDPAALILLTINAIKHRLRQDGDPVRSQTRGNLAAYVIQWLFGLTVIQTRNQGDRTKYTGIATKAAYSKRPREWSSDVHKHYLAVKARSLLPQSTPQDNSNRGRDNAIRSLAQVLEQQAVAAKTPADTPPTKPKGFDALPSATQKMILHATQKDAHRRTAAQPTEDLKGMLTMPNVSHIVTHLYNFLRNKRGFAVRFPTGFCTAIRNGTFLEDFNDAPGAMSIFCFGPQFTSQTTNNTAGDDPEAIAQQMQLKLNETTSGLSDKDIKTMTKLVYTVPSDFKDLADICQVMAGVHELIFGAASPLAEMLSDWFLYITGGNGNGGNTVGQLQSMAAADPTMACRLAWFIEKRRQ